MLRLDGIGRRILVATHRRSGTHLLIDLLRRQFAATQAKKWFGERTDSLYLAIERIDGVGVDGSRSDQPQLCDREVLRILRRANRPLLKTHGTPGFEDWRPPARELIKQLRHNSDTVYVHRDGRDVLCSLYVYMRGFAPWARVPLSEFLRQSVNGRSRVQVWADHVRAWAREEGVISLSFNDVVRRPADVVSGLSEGLSLPALNVVPLLPSRPHTVWHSRWQRLTSRSPQSTAIIAAGSLSQQTRDWRACFDRDDRAFFADHAGEMLIELGYENSVDWVDNPPEPKRRREHLSRSAR